MFERQAADFFLKNCKQTAQNVNKSFKIEKKTATFQTQNFALQTLGQILIGFPNGKPCKVYFKPFVSVHHCIFGIHFQSDDENIEPTRDPTKVIKAHCSSY